MLKYLLSLILAFPSIGLFAADSRPMLLVSVAPYKYFVEKIAGDTVDVMLMVPAGASAHTYEPTPRQVLTASKAEMWFIIGESFEGRVLPSFKAHNASLETVDLRKGVDLIIADPRSGACCCCCADCQDLHIWLSPKEAKIQAVTIADALSRRYPAYSEKYQSALKELLHELDQLNSDISAQLKPLKNRLIFVSHPAYAYFCRDYDLKQLSVEVEGKDPTPQQMTKLLNQVREAKTRRIYIQPQYSNKGAKLFASEIGAEVITLDPYSEDYFKSMREIAKQFSLN